MLLDYRHFNYLPDYGYTLYNGKSLIERDDFVVGAWCFARVFHILRRNNKNVHGIYTLRCRKKFEKESGNYCSLDKTQIHKILRYMRRVFDMKINFTDTEDNYVFVMDIEGKPIKHMFILTFSRVFFEFPYNEIAKDVLRLREAGIVNNVNYPHKGFLELFHTACISHKDAYSNGHSLFDYPCDDLSIKKLKEAFNFGSNRVQDVFKGSWQLENKISHFGKSNYMDWDKGFEKRADKYSENFNRLRQIKNAKSVRRRARKAL